MIARLRAGPNIVQVVYGPDVGVFIAEYLLSVAVLSPNSPQLEHL